jgi:aspartate 1-decarboxylase
VLLRICKSKIHRATVTDADLNYEGSITIDKSLLEVAGIFPYEMVQVYNVSNGARIETYAIEGEYGSGAVCINGAAARLFTQGDLIIVVAYALMEPDEAKSYLPSIILVDSDNRPVNRLIE